MICGLASYLLPPIQNLFETWLPWQEEQLERNIIQFGYRAQHRLVALTTQVKAYLDDNGGRKTKIDRWNLYDQAAKKLGVPGGFAELKRRLTTVSDDPKAASLLDDTRKFVELGERTQVKPMTHCLHMLSVSWVLSDRERKDMAASLFAENKTLGEVVPMIVKKYGDGAEVAMVLYIEY